MHPRKIRGNERNACFVAKCTFQCKMRVSLRNARIIAKMHVSLKKHEMRVAMQIQDDYMIGG